MTDSNGSGTSANPAVEDTGQISVAELLARNGQQVGSNAGGRRRRGAKGGISVAELTGEIPRIRDDSTAPTTRAQRRRAEEATEADSPEAHSSESHAAAPDSVGYQQSPGMVTAWSNSDREPELLSGNAAAGDLMWARDDHPDEAPAVVNPFEQAAVEHQDASSRWLSADEPQSAETRSTELPNDEAPEPAEKPRGHVKQWLILAGQAVVAVVIGALLFKGFERLWDMLPWVALVLAVLVILGLVATVRILRKTDDMFSIVIAIVVGVFVTMGPLVFLLSTS